MSTMHEAKTIPGLSREQWERAKPILFNTEMVRAIKEDRKTVTRRVVKPHYRESEIGFQVISNAHSGEYVRIEYFDELEDETRIMKDPYQPSDILYVRETWAVHPCNDRLPPTIPCQKTATGRDCYIYRADGISGKTPCGVHPSPHKWNPSIHMPKEAARLFLRVTDVRVERLQDITIEDIHSEGWPEYFMPTDDELKKMVTEFVSLWDSTIKPADRALYGWDANPWVWVIEFERISKEEA